MDVVDTHLHCWDRSRFRYDWLAGAGLPERFTPADTTVSGSDRWRAVFMEADRMPEQALAEARWALALGTEEHAPVEIVAAVAYAPLGGGAAAELATLSAVPGVTGIRRLLQDEPAAFFADATLVADLRAVGDEGLVFDACVREHQLGALATLAGAAPDTTVVLDHLGKPDTTDTASAAHGDWRTGIDALAARENVVVKLSGVVSSGGSFALVRPWVEACLEAFGPDRAVLGSDWPVSRTAGTPYRDWFAFVLEECGLTADEVAAVSHGTAERVYRLGA